LGPLRHSFEESMLKKSWKFHKIDVCGRIDRLIKWCLNFFLHNLWMCGVHVKKDGYAIIDILYIEDKYASKIYVM
jgi:hypothetical protein